MYKTGQRAANKKSYTNNDHNRFAIHLYLCQIYGRHKGKNLLCNMYLYSTKSNFACCFVWLWNLVADIEGGKEAEGVWEYGVEENIWT